MEIKEYSPEQINEFIKTLQQRANDIMIQALCFTSMEFSKDEKLLSDKLIWYLVTVDDVLHNPSILSPVEKREFINMHIAYVKKYNSIK